MVVKVAENNLSTDLQVLMTATTNDERFLKTLVSLEGQQTVRANPRGVKTVQKKQLLHELQLGLDFFSI